MKEFMKDLYEAMGGKHLSTWLVQVAVWAVIILALPMATWYLMMYCFVFSKLYTNFAVKTTKKRKLEKIV